jgi:uncharacterized protein
VDWYPWGEIALQRARSENKPIFLSIGYAACHWCHVMAHESFEDSHTAGVMNQYFINIKVDREERPDLDAIYMSAVVAMTGQGGWPMSLFLTPTGEPFYGGTYFPPRRRYNMPAFQEVLLGVAQAWEQNPGAVQQAGKELVSRLLPLPGLSQPSKLDPDLPGHAALHLAQTYDWQHGGWGQAPKFPQPMALEFLLRRASTDNSTLAFDVVNHALHAMAQGGMYDVVAGGFARYSTDDNWLVPHFEKMLYDNAQLALVYLHAYLISGEQQLRRVCETTLNFILRELRAPHSSSFPGFFSSMDADSEGEEGKYYLWSFDEIAAAVKDQQDFNFFQAAYSLNPEGNFDGRIILQRRASNAELARQYKLSEDGVMLRLQRLHDLLRQIRNQRQAPGLDDKVLTGWNGLALIALAEAGRYLGRDDYRIAAQQNAAFILRALHPGDLLFRSWRAGKAQHPGYLEDYASIILGLLALYQTDADPQWFQAALNLTGEMNTHFKDPQGGFFDTRDDQPVTIYRPKDLQDNATPSGNALAAQALLLLSAYQGNSNWREQAEYMLVNNDTILRNHPLFAGQWLSAYDLAVNPITEVAIVGNPALPSTQALWTTLWTHFRPHCVTALSDYPPSTFSPQLLQARPLVNGAPSAYVCRDFVCQQPVNTPQAFATQLDAFSHSDSS